MIKPNSNWNKPIIHAIRLLLGATLLWSGLVKIEHPYDFLTSVFQYEMLGPREALFVGISLPWVELTVSFCLLAGIFIEGAFAISLALGVIFTVAVGDALFRGLAISCGCFATQADDSRISFTTLARSVGVFAAASIGLIAMKRLSNGISGELRRNPTVFLRGH